MDWSQYKNFTEEEFKCKETGECEMLPEFMSRLQHLRTLYSRPMVVTSGYRSEMHSLEIDKNKAGEHSFGCAADIQCSGANARELLEYALYVGFTRIGIHQKGPHAGRYIHLGMGDQLGFKFPEAIWTY